MNETVQKVDIIAISVFDMVTVSTEVAIEIIFIRIISGDPSFSARELAKLREVLHISIGKHADQLTEEDLSEFGSSMLHVTALVLKAKYLQRNGHIEGNK